MDTQASQSPGAVGLVQSCWTVGLLAVFVLARFRRQLSPASVRRHLKAGGWRWARPRLAPATHAPSGQRKVDPASEWKLAQIVRALASTATVLSLDECELPLLPVIRNRWRKGPRVRVPTPGQNRKRAIFGALDARTGALQHAIRERKRAVDVVAFLEQLARAHPIGAVVLVLDTVITHDAKLVRAWLARPEHARFRLLWLPKYSAHEHTPIERVWGLMQDAVAANRLHGSIEALAHVAERFLAKARFRAPHPHPHPLPQVATTGIAEAA